jgi:hypothetical protein
LSSVLVAGEAAELFQLRNRSLRVERHGASIEPRPWSSRYRGWRDVQRRLGALAELEDEDVNGQDWEKPEVQVTPGGE